MDKTTSILPEKASELMELAMHSLALIEKDPKYMVEMCDWHCPGEIEDKSVCYVCLAGSILATEFKCNPNEDITPSSSGATCKDSYKLSAVDFFRKGHINGGLAFFSFDEQKFTYKQVDYIQYNIVVTPYSIDVNQFKEDMDKVINILKGLGH